MMSIRRFHTGCFAFALAMASVPAAAQSAFDVVGIRPGMTEAEAMAALKAHRPGMQVQKRNMRYDFRDGVQTHYTAEFLHEVWVRYDDAQGREDFRLYFSPLPSASRVVGLMRTVALKAPPTREQLIAQLNQKYGAPTVTSKDNMAWGEAGKPMCWRTNPKATSIGDGSGDILSSLLDRNGKPRGAWVPKDLSQCGVAVYAQMSGEPVFSLMMKMADYGLWATTQEKANAWVQQQQENAVKERLSKGAAPKL
ncbi:MAG: hypothetical protein LBE50_04760 [Gallionellaceae bacterium]|jgi:hypothetical protein|nr:hypothetical protein [Gallionellaceae bacterium]